MYTPIQTDEEDVTIDQVFFGGINVFLQQRSGLFRHLPRSSTGCSTAPACCGGSAPAGVETSAAQLGELTLSMLRGSAGFQRKEVRRLCQWLTRDPQPDLLVLTNALVAGCVPTSNETRRESRRHTPGRRRVPGRTAAAVQAAGLGADSSLWRSMSTHFSSTAATTPRSWPSIWQIDPAKFRLVPLGIDTADYPAVAPSIGCPPERSSPCAWATWRGWPPRRDFMCWWTRSSDSSNCRGMEAAELILAGWLGKRHRGIRGNTICQTARRRAGRRLPLPGHGRSGTEDQLLAQLHLLSVPTVYREPKGLYVLESLAAGVPVVQPNHGAFPELLAATGGGRLVPPQQPEALATACTSCCWTIHAAAIGRRRAYRRPRAFQCAQMAEQTLDRAAAAVCGYRSTPRAAWAHRGSDLAAN